MSRRTSSVELWSSSYFKTYFNFLVNMNLLVTEKSAKMCSKAFKQIGKVNILILLAAAFIVIYVEFLHYKIVASRWSKFSKSKYVFNEIYSFALKLQIHIKMSRNTSL